MDCRGVLLLNCAVGAALALSSCSAPDPGYLAFAERSAPGSSGDVGPGGSSGSPGPGGGSDGGGGGTEGGAGGDPVFGTSAFTAGSAPKNANGSSAQHGGTVEGKDCMAGACHGGNGAPGPTWAFGGTVKTAQTNGQAVVGAEVRITGPNGVEYGKTYTDANGNFWFEKVGGDIPANSRVGVRNANKQMLMSGFVGPGPNVGCNGTTCHGTGAAQGAVYLAP